MAKDYLYGGEDGVSFADDADDDGTLLHGLLCIFDLEDTALRGALFILATGPCSDMAGPAHNVTESLS